MDPRQGICFVTDSSVHCFCNIHNEKWTTCSMVRATWRMELEWSIRTVRELRPKEMIRQIPIKLTKRLISHLRLRHYSHYRTLKVKMLTGADHCNLFKVTMVGRRVNTEALGNNISSSLLLEVVRPACRFFPWLTRQLSVILINLILLLSNINDWWIADGAFSSFDVHFRE